MRRKPLLTVALAAVGLGAIVVGIHQELLHLVPNGTITTGWGRSLNHEEILLARLGVLGLVGAVAATRWRYATVAPVATGLVVIFYPVRAVVHYARDPGLYTEVTASGGGTVRYVLGAEPFLLVAGGLLLVSAGVVGWRTHDAGDDTTPTTPEPSSA